MDVHPHPHTLLQPICPNSGERNVQKVPVREFYQEFPHFPPVTHPHKTYSVTDPLL